MQQEEEETCFQAGLLIVLCQASVDGAILARNTLLWHVHASSANSWDCRFSGTVPVPDRFLVGHRLADGISTSEESWLQAFMDTPQEGIL